MPKLIKRKVTYESWNNLPIDTRNSGCYEHILERSYRLIHYCLSKRSKILLFRIDLNARSKHNENHNILKDNKILRQFLSFYTKKQQRKNIFWKYFWVKEESSTRKSHYHLFICVDGSKYQSAYRLQSDIFNEWIAFISRHSDGYEGIGDRCNKYKNEKGVSSYMLKRSEREGVEFKKCFKRVSYLAKENQKKMAAQKNNRFGSSVVPKTFETDRTMLSYSDKLRH
ncbi:inovirus Gp2 family protein [Pseudodesulfovibrio sp. F-1]|uniref:Inovirus Gp2 family protein n=1 Tax=Pseudodesulfovibrio alkaliphilus TaxID=2661613 RepID=A0A7K1KQC1_9BACT|nr:inovirus-type Gp2 protein [Pseudodesulfovibrio alkaliphilus]MUM78293.1 inovirus Gp2 family protein [Pseudodesulfovibrio alkaliphilus]